jgi:hypothetical protein
VLSLVAILGLTLFLGSAEAAQTVTHDLDFATNDISPYGLAAGGSVSATNQAFGVNWNEAASAGSIAHYEAFGVGADFGGTISAHTKGEFGLAFKYDVQQGLLDIDYPAKVNITYPDAGGFHPGDTIIIDTRSLQAAPGSIDYDPGEHVFKLDTVAELDGGVDGKLCVISCTGDIPFIPSFDTQKQTLNIFNEHVDQKFYGTIHEFGDVEQQVAGISGKIQSPKPSTATSVSTPNSLVAEGNDEQVDITWDVDSLSKYPWGASTPPNAYLNTSYDIIDGKVFVKVGQSHKFEFTPNMKVTLTLPRAMAWTEKTPGGAVVATGTSAAPRIAAGNKLEVKVPTDQSDTFSVTPTIALDSSIHHDFRQHFRTWGDLKVLQASIDIAGREIIPSVEICDPTGILDAVGVDDCFDTPGVSVPSYSQSVGPLFQKSFTAIDENPAIFDQTWKAPGFASHTETAQTLDPENIPVASAGGPYTVDEGSSITLDGGGSFDLDGDALTYTWTVDGPASLQSSGVHPTFDGLDGPHTYVATLTTCDTNANCTSAVTTIAVKNVVPTHAIDTSAKVTFGTGDALTAAVGTPLRMSASATDVGTDDTTYTWSATPVAPAAGSAAPSAAVWSPASRTYFNNGASADAHPSALGTLPFATTDTPSVTFRTAGFYTITVVVSDDDGGSTTSSFPVLVSDSGLAWQQRPWLQQQYALKGARKFTDAQLAGYLSFVRAASTVFDETGPMTSVADAAEVLLMKGPTDVDRVHARADLMTVWLNIATGALPFATAAPTLATVEPIIANRLATHSELIRAQQLLGSVEVCGLNPGHPNKC